jgi:hypothetical protein
VCWRENGGSGSVAIKREGGAGIGVQESGF